MGFYEANSKYVLLLGHQKQWGSGGPPPGGVLGAEPLGKGGPGLEAGSGHPDALPPRGFGGGAPKYVADFSFLHSSEHNIQLELGLVVILGGAH